jgi:hypothetical protein
MKLLSSLLRYAPVWLPAVLAGFVVMDLWLAGWVSPEPREPGRVPFNHAQHGDSLGVSCVYCHAGVLDKGRAQMPSKFTCLDCHRVPVSTAAGLPALDSALRKAPERPWDRGSRLPDHVRFHHSWHRIAGVDCVQCHGSVADIDAGLRAEVRMASCITCHEKDTVSTDCSFCHR